MSDMRIISEKEHRYAWCQMCSACDDECDAICNAKRMEKFNSLPQLSDVEEVCREFVDWWSCGCSSLIHEEGQPSVKCTVCKAQAILTQIKEAI